MCLHKKSKDFAMWSTCDTAHDLSHQSTILLLLFPSWKWMGPSLSNTVQLMKFSSRVFSFCFWWPTLENEGCSLSSWVWLHDSWLLLPAPFSTLGWICYQSVALTPILLFWQSCLTLWHTLPSFIPGLSFCLLIRSEKDITTIVIYLSLQIRRLTQWHWVDGDSFAGAVDFENEWGRDTLAWGLRSVLSYPLHILSLILHFNSCSSTSKGHPATPSIFASISAVVMFPGDCFYFMSIG